jgi:mono/diheme cytochrome c family protein
MMTGGATKLTALCTAAASVLMYAGAAPAQDAAAAQVKRGAVIYEENCSACHGRELADPPWAADLRAFPKTDRARFIDTVTRGIRGMPPWGDVLKRDEIEAVWGYVLSGGRP